MIFKQETVPQDFDLLAPFKSGTTLIEASAGTGKTYTISRIVLRLLLEYNMDLKQVLVVTFTEAATRELKHRIRALIATALQTFTSGTSDDPFFTALLSRINHTTAQKLLAGALHRFDDVAIYTIHGFCDRILRDNAFESGQSFTTELITDQRDIQKEITEDFWRMHFYNASSLFLSYALSCGANPITFSSLSSKNISTVKPEIRPRLQSIDTLQLEQQFLESINKTKLIWDADHDTITSLLRSPSLSKAKYKDAFVESLINECRVFFEIPPYNPKIVVDDLNKLSAQSLILATKKGCEAPSHVFFNQFETLLTIAKDLCMAFDNNLTVLQSAYLDFLQLELDKRKHEHNVMFFDDLLLRTHQALSSESAQLFANAVRASFCAALIDEFQDTDPIQYAIFHSLFSNHCMQFYIGDPKQAIFSFRGADIFTYMSASAKVDNTYTLSTNYRSCPELVNSINALFGKSKNPFLYNDISFYPAKSLSPEKTMKLVSPGSAPHAMQLWLKTQQRDTGLKTKEEIADAVAGEISGLLDSTKGNTAKIVSNDTTTELEPSHIAVLVRSHAEANLMQDTFSRYSINSTIDSDASVFTSSQAYDLELVLQAIMGASNIDYVKAALASGIMMQSSKCIDELSTNAESLNIYLSSFFGYNNLWHSRGVMSMIQAFLSQEQIRERLLATVKGERALTNIIHLCELLHKQEKEHAMSPARLFAWYQTKRRETDAQTADDELMRLESDDNAVHIVTIHKSKGLEYPVVFCPFSWASSKVPANRKNSPILYHDTTDKHSPVLCIGNKEIDENRHLVEREMLAENLRLLYVALTRAKARCYFVLCDTAAFETSAPAYLLHGTDNSEHAVTVLQATMQAPHVPTKVACEQLAEELFGTMCVTEIQNLPLPVPLQHNKEQQKILSYRQLSKAIPDTWHVSSFTSLSRHTQAEGKARELYDTSFGQEASQEAPMFPKGAITGVFFHDVLEHCDFTKPIDQTFVKEKLNEYGFSESLLPVALSMLDNCLQTPLPLQPETGFFFGKLQPSACLKEMGFYFPLKKIAPNDLLSLFSGSVTAESYAKLLSIESPKKLVFSPIQGFIKGFIDLVFEINGRYFLVDWKTNYLGANPSDYSSANLMQVMQNEHYTLQYHLYLVALHTYLSQRVTNYSYDDHMGQVLYVFLRGMQKESTEGTGIFSDRPERKFVEEMCRILIDK